MKRVLATLSLASLLAAACGGSGTPVAVATTAAPPTAARTTAAPTTAAPTPAPTPATQTLVFTADLLAANEVPPIADAEQSGSGAATVTMIVTKDTTGKMTAATAKFEWTLKGFPATTSIILSHIHQEVAGKNGGVKVDSGLKADSPIPLPTGGTSLTKDNLTVDLQVASDIIANPAGFYFNVHSVVHPGGVVRGQLKLKT